MAIKALICPSTHVGQAWDKVGTSWDRLPKSLICTSYVVPKITSYPTLGQLWDKIGGFWDGEDGKEWRRAREDWVRACDIRDSPAHDHGQLRNR